MEQEYKERKRSKRHRIKRNHISSKDAIECVKSFAQHAMQVESKRKAKYVVNQEIIIIND